MSKDTTLEPQSHDDATSSRARSIVAQLSTDEKVRLVSGATVWTTEQLPAVGVAPVLMTDGPHGIRKQIESGDHVGMGASLPATCFPPAVTLGSSWDRELIRRVGAALGREAREQEVDVLLGPGLNLKRHPAAGRNFEYFSEDPYLSGQLAAAMVEGIQSVGVGACVKHFAVNNQESNRMRLDTIVDERTLRELYLSGFEAAVTQARPRMVMSAYNLVNGEHAGESHRLLTGILREEWGFDGAVVSDWLAVAGRPAGIAAGLDLEMPSSAGAWDDRVRAALTEGTLSVGSLDTTCERLVALAWVSENQRGGDPAAPLDLDQHHALAREAAAAGTVLLSNDGLLPLTASGRIAVIGAFATYPRFQGAGSSSVNATRIDTLHDVLLNKVGGDAQIEYAEGFDPHTGSVTREQLSEARAAAARADVVILMVGLPARLESEGFDRSTLRMPTDLETLIDVVSNANPRTVVALSNGGALELPTLPSSGAVVESYLGGQASGSALVDVLFGDAEPGGRLAESFARSRLDLPSDANFDSNPTQVQYRETLYVGYRFHDSFDIAPHFCFGHGLSYTTFDYSDLTVEGTGSELAVSVTVANTGGRAGSDVVQLYVHDVTSSVFRPDQELKAFHKVQLAAGASTRVTLQLDRRSFATYDVTIRGWVVEAGEFELRVGSSSRDIRLRATVTIDSADVITAVAAPATALATDDEFAALLGRPIPPPPARWPLGEDSTIDDLAQSAPGRALRSVLRRVVSREIGEPDDPGIKAMMEAVVGEMPMRALVMSAGGRISFGLLDRVLRVLNALGRWRR